MMKKLLIFALIPAFFLGGCVNSLDDYNIDSKKPSKVDAAPLFSNSTKGLNDVLNSVNVNTNVFRFYVQHLATTTYLEEPRYNMVTRTIPQALWNAMYVSTLADLKEAKGIIEANQILNADVKKNQIATIDVMQVYAYSVLVNTFGDIPYTESLDINNPQPKYDDAKTVTLDLLSRLDTDIAALNADADGFGTADIIYGGNVGKWQKFANSLRLKLAMVIADVDPGTAGAKIAASAALPLITSNADNALFKYVGAPNNNPLSNDVPPRSARQDFVMANTLVDEMNTLNDPRRAAYFTTVGGEYVGGKYGFSNVYANFSTFSTKVTATTFPGNMLDASEVNFLLAEAVERGFITGDAKSYYDAAITASLAYWGVTGVEDYLAQATVDYSNAGSGASWQEKIGTQKWIALYNRGFDAWTDWRRLDFPVLVAPDASGVPPIPKRLIYPIIENSLNAANTKAAAAAIGGDDSATRLFWDVK